MFDVRKSGDGWEVDIKGHWVKANCEADARQLALLPELVQGVSEERMSPQFGEQLERCLAVCDRNRVGSVAIRRLERYRRKIQG